MDPASPATLRQAAPGPHVQVLEAGATQEHAQKTEGVAPHTTPNSPSPAAALRVATPAMDPANPATVQAPQTAPGPHVQVLEAGAMQAHAQKTEGVAPHTTLNSPSPAAALRVAAPAMGHASPATLRQTAPGPHVQVLEAGATQAHAQKTEGVAPHTTPNSPSPAAALRVATPAMDPANPATVQAPQTAPGPHVQVLEAGATQAHAIGCHSHQQPTVAPHTTRTSSSPVVALRSARPAMGHASPATVQAQPTAPGPRV